MASRAPAEPRMVLRFLAALCFTCSVVDDASRRGRGASVVGVRERRKAVDRRVASIVKERIVVVASHHLRPTIQLMSSQVGRTSHCRRMLVQCVSSVLQCHKGEERGKARVGPGTDQTDMHVATSSSERSSWEADC